VRGKRKNKGEKQLMIVNEEGKFNKDVLAMGNNFIIKLSNFYRHIMEDNTKWS
jgi:hypothetical protein